MSPSLRARILTQAWNDPGRLLGGMALLGIAAVAAALATQHVFGMQPCPWCILQRVIFLAISLVCTLGLLWRGPMGRRLAAGLGLLLAVAGSACALWQHLAAASDSCALTLADRIVSGLGLDALWPAVFLASAGCADAAENLLGVPYPFWSLALFMLIGIGCVRTIGRTRRGTQRQAVWR